MVAENHGTVYNQVGSHYWSFKHGVGKGTIVVHLVHFTSMGLFGNPMNGTIEVVLHTGDGKVVGSRPLTSNGRVAELEWPGQLRLAELCHYVLAQTVQVFAEYRDASGRSH